MPAFAAQDRSKWLHFLTENCTPITRFPLISALYGFASPQAGIPRGGRKGIEKGTRPR
jgi:hypothetical protein